MSKIIYDDIRKIVEYNMRNVQGLDGDNIDFAWYNSYTNSEGDSINIEFPLTKLRDMISQSILDTITNCTSSGDLTSGNSKGNVSLSRDNSKIKLTISGSSEKVAKNGNSIQATIPIGAVITSVTGGSGAPAIGISNTTPIQLNGTIQEGSDIVEVE